MTKTEKYHYRFGPSFEDRFTLSRNGADVLKEENEDKELKVQSIMTRVSIHFSRVTQLSCRSIECQSAQERRKFREFERR